MNQDGILILSLRAGQVSAGVVHPGVAAVDVGVVAAHVLTAGKAGELSFFPSYLTSVIG